MAKAVMRTSTEALSAEDLKILLVDDDEDIRFLMAKILRGEGYSVIEAANAREAEEAALMQTPDLVLMDIGMPGEDGLSAIWRMRGHQELALVPVLIVSAYDSYDLRADAAAEGCKGYLTKPVDPIVLRSVVGKILGVSTSDVS